MSNVNNILPSGRTFTEMRTVMENKNKLEYKGQLYVSDKAKHTIAYPDRAITEEDNNKVLVSNTEGDVNLTKIINDVLEDDAISGAKLYKTGLILTDNSIENIKDNYILTHGKYIHHITLSLYSKTRYVTLATDDTYSYTDASSVPNFNMTETISAYVYKSDGTWYDAGGAVASTSVSLTTDSVTPNYPITFTNIPQLSVASGVASLTNRFDLSGEIVYPENNNITSLIANFSAGNFFITKQDLSKLTNLTTLNDGSFKDNIVLDTIILPASITTVGNNIFTNCPIKYAVMPSGGLSRLPKTNLLTVEINGGAEIPNNALQNCTSLTSAKIGDTVTSIGSGAFSGCSNLKIATIGDSVTSIGNSAFNNCTSLTSVTIPDSVTSIGTSAFEDCSSLTSITIGDGVTSIGNYAFSGCSSLTSITIPDSVISIKWMAFNNCTSLTSAIIGDSVTSIENYAFSGCTSLTSLTVLAATPPTIQSYTLHNVPATCLIYVPEKSVDTYKNRTNWSSRANYIRSITEV